MPKIVLFRPENDSKLRLIKFQLRTYTSFGYESWVIVFHYYFRWTPVSHLKGGYQRHIHPIVISSVARAKALRSRETAVVALLNLKQVPPLAIYFADAGQMTRSG